MRKLFKGILNFLSFIPCIRKYHKEWKLFGRVPFGLLHISWMHRKIRGINRGVKFPLHFTSRIIAPKNLKIHKDATTIGSFAMSGGCYFQALNGIKIGENFLFAPGVKLISSNHDFHDKSKIAEASPIKIGSNVWLGANVVILPGVEIGNNVIVGAGAVVTKSFSDNVIIGGNPAKIIKENKPDTE
jgi:acetyltransferase-like isoleucine patch superfamily enzyme